MSCLVHALLHRHAFNVLLLMGLKAEDLRAVAFLLTASDWQGQLPELLPAQLLGGLLAPAGGPAAGSGAVCPGNALWVR